MNNENLPEENDSSDEDYVPDTKLTENLSEVESDGELEEPLSDGDEAAPRPKKRQRQPKKPRRKSTPEPEVKPQEINKEEEKKHDDDLWADFIKDTGFRPKNSKTQLQETSKPKSTENKSEEKPKETVKVTQVLEFAGEEIRVEKEVSKTPIAKKGGIGSVLNQLGKKRKINTLEKSKMDWDRFKKEENIEDELKTHNKGKDGYLEKQEFLQRADLRRFEIEKEVRAVERSKRLNNYNQ